MQRLFSFRQGDRAEYLAQYILSAFAISVPVPRQEDVGSDFHCSLLKREGNNLRPYLPFNIQIKSFGAQILSEGIPFGGITNGGKWRSHEMDQLLQTDTPFLIGIVNKEKDEQWLELFSTITRYFIHYNWNNLGKPRQVNLIPYKPDGEGHLGGGTSEDLEEKPGIPKKLLKLPIGQPILRISITDSENSDKIEEIKHLLEPYLRLDQENAVFARLGLGYFNWPLIMKPGQPLGITGVGLVSPLYDNPMVANQVKVLARIVASLLQTYQHSGMKKEILEWERVLGQLPIAAEPNVICQSVQKALKFAHS